MSASALLAQLGWWSLCVMTIIELTLALPWVRWVSRVLNALALTLTALFEESLSEEEREVYLRRVAFRMLGESLMGTLYLGVVLSTLIGLETLGTRLMFSSLMGGEALIGLTLIGTCYVALRVKIIARRAERAQALLTPSSDQDYSEFSRALHSFALDHSTVARLSFAWEQRHTRRLMNTLTHDPATRPVWVCGLARAGTTIVTNILYETGRFGSLTYRDMPFPLAPSRWRALQRIRSANEAPLRERAHGDGLMVGLDSPEALEEVFWHTFEPTPYHDESALSSYRPQDETLSALHAYMRSVTLSRHPHDPPRYLAKNNNHLIRLPSLIEAFPDATFIIPIRDPLEHAQSLLRQHLKWLERHARDTFSRRYMGWLRHYEFGADHRPFSLEGLTRAELSTAGHDSSPDSNAQRASSYEPDELNYWLERWVDAHIWIMSLRCPQLYLLDTRALSDHPRDTLSALSARLELSLDARELDRCVQMISSTPIRSAVIPANPMLLERATTLYQELTRSS